MLHTSTNYISQTISTFLGLFHAAIAQSGSAVCPWAVKPNPLAIAQKIGASLNCPIETTSELIECLRNADADDLARQAVAVSVSILSETL